MKESGGATWADAAIVFMDHVNNSGTVFLLSIGAFLLYIVILSVILYKVLLPKNASLRDILILTRNRSRSEDAKLFDEVDKGLKKRKALTLKDGKASGGKRNT